MTGLPAVPGRRRSAPAVAESYRSGGLHRSRSGRIDDAATPYLFRLAGRLIGGTEFSPEDTADARRRIAEFFHRHLG
ncbi:hypothetical protein [Nocardioides sp. YIM 152588]|uniref:hypothetical protein n=1 Tax=Nocardioides sp. YIM 152588 TaxID=3158259 RepID=UPI0032E45D13